MTRPSWDDYFMDMAHHVATRATCPRRHVGCVLVKNKQVLCTGYNGSLPGHPHCDDIGCLTQGVSGCLRTIHAEANAICQAARHGINLSGSIIYVTTSPCMVCFKSVVAAGIVEVVYDSEYREQEFLGFAQLAGVRVRRHESVRSSGESGRSCAQDGTEVHAVCAKREHGS